MLLKRRRLAASPVTRDFLRSPAVLGNKLTVLCSSERFPLLRVSDLAASSRRQSRQVGGLAGRFTYFNELFFLCCLAKLARPLACAPQAIYFVLSPPCELPRRTPLPYPALLCYLFRMTTLPRPNGPKPSVRYVSKSMGGTTPIVCDSKPSGVTNKKIKQYINKTNYSPPPVTIY